MAKKMYYVTFVYVNDHTPGFYVAGEDRDEAVKVANMVAKPGYYCLTVEPSCIALDQAYKYIQGPVMALVDGKLTNVKVEGPKYEDV